MHRKIQDGRHIVAGVARVGVRDDQYGTIDLLTTTGAMVPLDLPLRAMAPVIMGLFSAASAVQERRYAATGERSVLALPVREAAAAAVMAAGERHVVVSLRLEGDAIFRFSLPAPIAARLGQALRTAAPSPLN